MHLRSRIRLAPALLALWLAGCSLEPSPPPSPAAVQVAAEADGFQEVLPQVGGGAGYVGYDYAEGTLDFATPENNARNRAHVKQVFGV